MYPSKDARELGILLRLSRQLDVVGDVTATVDNPSELLAWALVLSKPRVVAWRAEGSGHGFLQVSATRRRAPIRGRVAAVLDGEQHSEFWQALGLEELSGGDRRELKVQDLSSAWDVMPVASPAADDAAHRSDDPGPPVPPAASS